MGHMEARLREAAKLGFDRAIAPRAKGAASAPIELVELRRVQELLDLFGTGGA